MTFPDLWKFATRHGDIVQQRDELEHVFNLIQGCESYLEVGTAEGNSLYVLSHALKPNSKISFVDLGERHTLQERTEVLVKINNLHNIHPIFGNSHDVRNIAHANMYGDYDVVFIDAGHRYEDVVLDAMMYGPMAKKFIIFHDIKMPAVDLAFNWYIRETNRDKLKNVSKFIKSENYGYGIIRL